MILGDSERVDTAGPGPATLAHIPTDRTKVLSGRPRPSTSSSAISRTAARSGKGDYIGAVYRSGQEGISSRAKEREQSSLPSTTPDLSQATADVALAMRTRDRRPGNMARPRSRMEVSGMKRSSQALQQDEEGRRVLEKLAKELRRAEDYDNKQKNDIRTQEDEDALDIMQSKAAIALISQGIKSLELGFGWGD